MNQAQKEQKKGLYEIFCSQIPSLEQKVKAAADAQETDLQGKLTEIDGLRGDYSGDWPGGSVHEITIGSKSHPQRVITLQFEVQEKPGQKFTKPGKREKEIVVVTINRG